MNNIKAEAPRIEQPKNLKIKLKEHQKSSVYAMLQLEDKGEIRLKLNSSVGTKGTINLPDNAIADEANIFGNNYWYHSWYYRNNGEFKEIEYLINTNFGVLSDKVGAGKTLTVVAMIVSSLIPRNNPKIINSTQFTSIKYLDAVEPIKTNLILIPHNLSSQWYKTFIENTRLRVKLIHRHSVLDSIKSVYKISEDSETQKELDILPEQCLEHYDVVIVTSSMAQDFFTKYKEVKWSRIIIDEVLSIKLPADIPWQANFIWFITATPSGLAYIKKLYIREIFSNLQKVVFNYLIVKNNDEYVSSSMDLPALNQILIHCLTPKAIGMIKEFVNEDVMNMINAGNIVEAVGKINCNADTDDNIFKAITTKLEKEIHNKKAELKYQSERIADDAKAHEETVKKLGEKVKSLEDKLKSIEEKIKSYANESCPVCLMDFTNPAVMKCCNNLFCVPCLTMINGLCPMCRAPFNLKDIHVIVKTEEKKTKGKKVEVPKELLSKNDNLINIINKKPDGKFLIFSCYENTNDSIGRLLKENGISFAKLSGSCGAVTNTIDRFNKREVKVLLLNAQYYGSGLNLQMASDIIIYHEMNKELETQIIGRAQRIGRTEPLNVYYLLNDGEKHNVSNPSLDISIYDPNDKQFLEFIAGNNYDNKVNTNAEVGEFWDSDEEVAFKKAEAKRQKALEKKLKETAPKKTRKTTKKTAKAAKDADNEV
jgi:SNF2 family DNA or RNA helicase